MNAANAALATQLLLQSLLTAQSIGQAIAKAHAEGRDLSEPELDALVGNDDAARKRLADAIAAARP